MINCETVIITQKNWLNESKWIDALARAYATQFWGATWKELLAIRDSRGKVIKQFGTCDRDGDVYPETLELLDRVNVSAADSSWPEKIWKLANDGFLFTKKGQKVSPYWTIESAQKELRTYVSTQKGLGYGGEILLAVKNDAILGFTAYACGYGESGLAIAEKRFPTKRLYVPPEASTASSMTVKDLLSKYLSANDYSIGVFLDHAVSEMARGQKLGSYLFDLRLNRLLEIGADIMFGRTMITQPPQYIGNYLARGFIPIAADGTDEFSRAKHYFVAKHDEIAQRASR
ncbi:MAG: hypothetical protein WC766_01010 [Patescibacteria group bacterium]|jgi:hypothetical protein